MVLEATEDEARAHKAEKSHSSYLKRYEDEFEIISLSCLENKDGDIVEEPLVSEMRDVENEALLQIALKDLPELLDLLDKVDFHIIHEMYLSDNRKILRQLSQEMGIPVMTLQNRKIKRFSMLREKIS